MNPDKGPMTVVVWLLVFVALSILVVWLPFILAKMDAPPTNYIVPWLIVALGVVLAWRLER